MTDAVRSSALRAAPAAASGARPTLEAFLAEASPERALALWLQLLDGGRPRSGAHLVRLLERDIATIDVRVARQLDAILHHPRFQRLEAAWRGLAYLVSQADRTRDAADGPPIKVRVLFASWPEVVRDLEKAIEFDQSQIYKKVYENEFGAAGGEPFGVVLCDYEMSHRPLPGRATDDIAALEALSHVGAAAFAPIIVGAHPRLLGLDTFRELEIPFDIARTFESAEYARWRALRASEDSRFLGLTVPRVLWRLPHDDDGSRRDGFRYCEDVSAPDGSGYLWGTAVWCFGAVLIRAFSDHGWLANIRGVPPDGEGGGVLRDLVLHAFATDRDQVAIRWSTDVQIVDRLEESLAELGIMALCGCKDTPWAAFYSNASVQQPKRYDTRAATTNARLSSMLQYMLSVSRFAHFLKVIGRNKIGSFLNADDCQRELGEWLTRYCIQDDEATAGMKARHPLREAQVQVREHPGKPGSYLCVVHLRPHFQLDQVTSAMRLVTEFAPVHAD